MSTNTAAWLTAEATPLEIKEAPYTSPSEHEILIKNGAVAINPVDWYIQAMGSTFFPGLKHPCLLGGDVAGEVAEVGSAVTRFKVGDRVLGFALGPGTNNTERAGFQLYTIVPDNVASPIPDSMSYESASVLPLCLSTAAVGLFQKDLLALEYPSLSPKPTGKTLLVWGGASSVGSNAIQLGVAAGYEVITTASPKNFEYAKKLGASQVFDYNSKTVVGDLIEAFKDKEVAGAIDCTGDPSVFDSCTAILSGTQGRKFFATVRPSAKEAPEGITVKYVLSSGISDNEVSKVIFIDYLPQALAEGKYVAAPDAYVVGKGLEHFQAGLDLWKKGVSAKKVVISL